MKPDASEPQSLAEIATNTDANPDVWELRLYVAGKTAKSMAAFENLTRICEQHLSGKYKIEVVDLLVLQRYLLLQPHRGKPLSRIPSAVSLLRVVRVWQRRDSALRRCV